MVSRIFYTLPPKFVSLVDARGRIIVPAGVISTYDKAKMKGLIEDEELHTHHDIPQPACLFFPPSKGT